jgi:hypothetical protein
VNRRPEVTITCQQFGEKLFVTPAKAGVQDIRINKINKFWIPACAGMTDSDVFRTFSTNS